MTKQQYAKLAPLQRLQLWIDMPVSKIKEFIEIDREVKLGVVGYPNSFISEQEQQTYESNN